MDDFLMTAGTWALRLLAVECLAFVLLFATLAPWRSTAMGRHMMTFMIVLSAIVLYVAIAPLLGLEVTARLWSRLAAFAMLAATVGWQVVLLVRAQLENLRISREVSREDLRS